MSQSKFSGTRKVTLRYQKFGMKIDFEISRVDCIFMAMDEWMADLSVLRSEQQHFSYMYIRKNGR